MLRIDYLRGELRPTSPDHPPYFDDKHSFVLRIDLARIEIPPASLSDLLNRCAFAYPGSPLRKLTITIEKRTDHRRTPPLHGPAGSKPSQMTRDAK